MTLTPNGFGYDGPTGDVPQLQWARNQEAAQAVNSFEGVMAGFNVQPSSSTPRAVTVLGPGIAYACGVRIDMDVNTPILHDPVASGTRLDYGVLQIDWVNKRATLEAIPGSATSPPALTRTAGVLWQMPLYSVSVAAGGGLFAASSLVPRKPIPRRTRKLTAAKWNSVNIPKTSSGTDLQTLTFPDPGWPYLLEIVARQAISYQDTGSNVVGLRIPGLVTLAVTNGGAELARTNDATWGEDQNGSDGPINDTLDLTHCTEPMTGQGTLHLVAIPRNTTATVVASDLGVNTFYVKQIPA